MTGAVRGESVKNLRIVHIIDYSDRSAVVDLGMGIRRCHPRKINDLSLELKEFEY